MYDYMKLRVLNSAAILEILKNKAIEWRGDFNYSTSELSSYPIKGYLMGFRLRLKSKSLLEIRGSLHKFYKERNDGDFTFRELCLAIDQLSRILDTDPELFEIVNLEFGVNIDPGMDASEIIRNIVAYCNCEPLKPYQNVPNAFMIEFELTDHYFKIYDKGKQYNSKNTLRIEGKSCRMRYHAGFGIKTLKDLLNKSAMLKAGERLLVMIQKLIFDDEFISNSIVRTKDQQIYAELSNPRNWSKHKKNKSRLQKRKEDRYKLLIFTKGKYNYGKIIHSKTKMKISELLSG